jgi:hypothetical protein
MSTRRPPSSPSSPPFRSRPDQLDARHVVRRPRRAAWWGLSTVAGGLCLVASAVAAAQTAPPASCSAPEFRQFDFWVGDWNVTNPVGKAAGTNTIDRPYGDCVVQEHWVGASGDRGTSLNTYDVGRKQWHQTWVDNQGQLVKLDGAFANGTMTMTGEAISAKTGKPYLNRIRWSRENGDPDKVRQIWDTSTDGGKTWTVAFNGLYVRRKATG